MLSPVSTDAGNDPACRRNTEPGHVCFDKFGDPWFRAEVGPRPGTTCWSETLARLDDEHAADRSELARFAEWLDGFTRFEQAAIS